MTRTYITTHRLTLDMEVQVEADFEHEAIEKATTAINAALDGLYQTHTTFTAIDDSLATTDAQMYCPQCLNPHTQRHA